MIKRSPILVYLLLWITLGIYGLFWFFQTMRFLDSRHPEYVSKTRRIGWFVGLYMSTYLLGFAAIMIIVSSGIEPSPWFVGMFICLWLMAMAWNVFVPIAVWHISRRVRETQAHIGMEDAIKPGISVLAYFLWFAAFPYIQHHLNRLIEQETEMKA